MQPMATRDHNAAHCMTHLMDGPSAHLNMSKTKWINCVLKCILTCNLYCGQWKTETQTEAVTEAADDNCIQLQFACVCGLSISNDQPCWQGHMPNWGRQSVSQCTDMSWHANVRCLRVLRQVHNRISSNNSCIRWWCQVLNALIAATATAAALWEF